MPYRVLPPSGEDGDIWAGHARYMPLYLYRAVICSSLVLEDDLPLSLPGRGRLFPVWEGYGVGITLLYTLEGAIDYG